MYKYLLIANRPQAHEKGLFFVKDKSNSSLKSFFKKALVKKNSYAGRIVVKMYNRYCKYAINLENDYKKYYSKEFGTYDEYLSIRYNLSDNEVNYFKKHKSFYVNLNYGQEVDIIYLFEEESFKKVFDKCFGESFYEN